MAERQLLDCTLRDGGYINDWEFGHANIIEIFERLVSAGVEYIEIGFLDERREFDINRTIMPDTESANKIFKGIDKGNSLVLGMIDYGTCSIENLQLCQDTFIDGIRVIFKEHLRDEALAFCNDVQKLGYKVFAQMVSVTTYTDEALKEYAECCNRIKPFATSMVDTYGLLDEEHLMHIYSILDKYLDSEIKAGYHAHNNFQLGFANVRRFLASGTKRDILADGTLYGMGKSAGNAPIELLMMFMNEKLGGSYDITQALEAIDNVIMDIYKKQYWGYNSFFFLASYTNCHPNYVQYLMNKRTLSVKQIKEILLGIRPDKKLMYDAGYAEKVYLDYQSIRCDDTNSIAVLKEKLSNKDILLLGPGKNLRRQREAISAYIGSNAPVIIAVNFVPDMFQADYVFLTKAKRYTQLIRDMGNGMSPCAEIIATSNVTKTSGDFHYVLNYSSLIDLDTEIIDNSLVMLLKSMLLLGVKKVSLAGFDGYSRTEDNYYDVSREYSFAKAKSDYLNEYVRSYLTQISDMLDVRFITDSFYCC